MNTFHRFDKEPEQSRCKCCCVKTVKVIGYIGIGLLIAAVTIMLIWSVGYASTKIFGYPPQGYFNMTFVIFILGFAEVMCLLMVSLILTLVGHNIYTSIRSCSDKPESSAATPV